MIPSRRNSSGIAYASAHYEEVKPDVQGRILSAVTGLYLAVRNDWLRWVTADGQLLLTPMELWEQERQHAQQEAQRAEQERQHARTRTLNGPNKSANGRNKNANALNTPSNYLQSTRSALAIWNSSRNR